MAKGPDGILAQALALHRGGRLAEAAALYEAVLQRAPAHPEALHLLGLLRVAEGDYDAGISLVRRAVAAAPRSALFRANLGVALLRDRRYAEAAGELRQAIELEPMLPDAHDHLAGALALNGDGEGAIAVLRNAARRFPRDPRFGVRLSALLL